MKEITSDVYETTKQELSLKNMVDGPVKIGYKEENIVIPEHILHVFHEKLRYFDIEDIEKNYDFLSNPERIPKEISDWYLLEKFEIDKDEKRKNGVLRNVYEYLFRLYYMNIEPWFTGFDTERLMERETGLSKEQRKEARKYNELTSFGLPRNSDNKTMILDAFYGSYNFNIALLYGVNMRDFNHIISENFKVCEFDIVDRKDKMMRGVFSYKNINKESYEGKEEELNSALNALETEKFILTFRVLSEDYSILGSNGYFPRGKKLLVESIERENGGDNELLETPETYNFDDLLNRIVSSSIY